MSNYFPTIEQNESVAAAALQRLLQDVLEGAVEEKNLLSAFRLPKTCTPRLRHLVEG